MGKKGKVKIVYIEKKQKPKEAKVVIKVEEPKEQKPKKVNLIVKYEKEQKLEKIPTDKIERIPKDKLKRLVVGKQIKPYKWEGKWIKAN